jgi:hypothetical protein
LSRTERIAIFASVLGCAAASAQVPKLPLASNDEGSAYVAPNVTPTEKSVDTNGATVGVQHNDGSNAHAGVDTSGVRPTYSLGGSTPGNVSYSVDGFSDGKDNKGVKAGVTIKY